MPLNEHEQKILDEIERQFYEDDPDFATSVSSTRLRARNLQPKWGIATAVGGLAIMLVAFTWNSFIALGGFVLMAVSLAWTLTSIRRRAGGGAARRWRISPRRRDDLNS